MVQVAQVRSKVLAGREADGFFRVLRARARRARQDKVYTRAQGNTFGYEGHAVGRLLEREASQSARRVGVPARAQAATSALFAKEGSA